MFLKEIWRDRRKIALMSVVDFKSSFKASVLSWFWVLINPALTIFMYLFAFFANSSDISTTSVVHFDNTSDFYFIDAKPKSIDVDNTAWIIIGVMAWSYLSSMMSSGAGSIRQYSWMVTKIGTPLSTPPALTCLSRSIIGIPMIIISWFIYMIITSTTNSNTSVISLNILQLPLMIILSFLFMLFWSIFISPFASISKDVNNMLLILPMFLQWVSGLFLPLNADNFNKGIGIVFRINPLNFLLEGFRGSIEGTSLFWNDAISLISFLFCIVILGILASFVSSKRIKKITVDLI